RPTWKTPRRLHADDADAPLDRPQREADPRAQAAAADWNEHGLDVRKLLRELEPERSLAGDHDLVLERVHERGAAVLDVRRSRGDGVLEHSPRELDVRAVVLRRLHL